ncbi:hybrid sensor histidine kinase/response regulator transcription factor [Flavobacterium sp. JAS]|uniref:hybrid sensor histidine kinase/response regulator transcription factor n=1 Tax=Flavobacterium sp. JAS TaxID=2897329 RepID=UPI0021030B45|nr:hybrid sensor histidine kinase/response regulator transcription factor [Flavobacterium sp. JAS]
MNCTFLCLLFFVVNNVSGQSEANNIAFNYLSIKDGLSQNSVMTIFKDSKGIMWFGTRDGINRYDGYSFEVFRHDSKDSTSISNNSIRAISEDLSGRLWIGTAHGLNVFDPSTGEFKAYFNVNNKKHSLSNDAVLSILCAKNGDLWIGTENGLNLKKRNDEKFIKFLNNPKSLSTISDNHVYTLFQDSKGGIWAGTRFGGLNKYNNIDGSFEKFKYSPKIKNSISSNFITCIAEDKDGLIWVGTSMGLNVMKKDKSFDHFYHNMENSSSVSNNMIRALTFDNLGNLWIATYQGLSYLEIKKKHFQVYKHVDGGYNSLSHNSIRSLLFDKNGYLWVGTYFAGVNIFNSNSSKFSYFSYNPMNKNSLGFNIVGAMCEDDKGNIYLGTEGGGLFYFDKYNHSFSSKNIFFGKKINFYTIKSILFDSKKRLWIGTYEDGLYMVDLNKGKYKSFKETPNNSEGLWDNTILCMLEDRNGNIWVGTNQGLNLYNSTNNIITKKHITNSSSDSFQDSIINCLYEDEEKTIWIGTNSNGLIKYIDGSIKYYVLDSKDNNSINSNHIYSISQDSEKRLWIGTYGGGLNLMNRKNETFKSFTIADGLLNNIVYGLVEDVYNKLWISTPSGMSSFDYKLKLFKNYTANKGLPIEEFNEHSILKHTDGTIYLGGFNGLMSFKPKEMKNNFYRPQIVLTKLKLFNKIIKPNDESGLLKTSLDKSKELIFSSRDNVFTIEYTAFNYPLTGQNKYAYKLEGFEDKWNYVGDMRSATYTNLDAGSYVFKVKVSNGNDAWSDNIVSINVIKKPPFWKTFYAYFIYLVFFVFVFYTIRRYILVKLHLENSLKLKKLEHKELEKLTKLKLNFFTNISHDFRTPLTLIDGPLQEILKSSKNTPMHDQLLLIKKNVSFMLRLIDQLMDFKKIESAKIPLNLLSEPLVPFVKEVVYSFEEFAKTQNIKYVFTSRFPDKKILFDKSKLEKVLYNVLSNAFKFTPEKGEIKVELYAVNQNKFGPNYKFEITEYIEIRVMNTGSSINEKNIDKIFKRFYQEKNRNVYSPSGTGIGLTVAKGLMELHKGYINVKSEKDKVVEFFIGLPLNDVYTSEEKINEIQYYKDQKDINEISKISKTKKSLTHQYNIMIVEDNHDLLNFLEQSLATDYNVITAKDGKMALDLIDDKNHPSIIISDIMMPNMSGLELCRVLKFNSKTSHIPIILLTARSSKLIELDGYETGADDFISKPFNMDLLKSKIKSILSSRERIVNHSRKEILLNESEINRTSSDEAFLNKVCNYIRDNIEDPNLNVNNIGEFIGISRVHFFRKIKAITGKSPVVFIRDFRLSTAAKLLELDNYNVNEVCYKVGFQDIGYFRRCFKKKYNLSAIEFSKRTKNENIN